MRHEMKAWLKALLAAAIGGAAGAVTQVGAGVTKPKDLAVSAVTGAILAAAAYAVKSPFDKSEPPVAKAQVAEEGGGTPSTGKSE